ncbi:uncharacterized protein N7479_007903 [Penicillium vulpinum]|uniref:uncharacterized protein n=1 Tax=Penicillium vulpinum TaxID=29845 RepID=UPI002547B1B4|nr:uncharacterized protein N7479_007903 [Penicillium vulpinum]KAJ5960753.1 hypothetical protein N7479_007903 [Penicillium vulpinum]
MVCPSIRNLEDWLKDLSRWRERCHMWIHQEWENMCNDPVAWKEGDMPGSNAGIVSSYKDLASLRNWRIMNPPDNFTVGAQGDSIEVGQLQWRPKNVRLSDAGVIYAFLTLPADYRIHYLTYDFDHQAHVRKERVLKAPTVTCYQNNLRTLVTCKGVYVFTGGYNDAGWLLADDYPNNLPFFQAGLVVAPSHVKTFDTLNVQLAKYEPRNSFLREPGFTENAWKRGDRDNSTGPMAFQSLEEQFVERYIEFKWQPSDFINFGHIPIRTKIIESNKTEAVTTRQKRKRTESGNESRESFPCSSQLSASGTEVITERKLDRPVDNSDDYISFKTLWAELAAIESSPKYMELFATVSMMENMYQIWRHNRMAVRMVQHNASPSDATLVLDLMQTLSPRLIFLIMGVDKDTGRIALENAFNYNSAMISFKQQVDLLEEGVVKHAYMNCYSYFWELATPKIEIRQPFIKLEREEGSDSGLRSQDPRQCTEIQGMNFRPSQASFPHFMQQGL